MDINGTIAAVFGGASGIGLKTIVELLNRNAKGVTIFDLPSPAVEDAVAKLQSQFDKNRVIFIPCDVTVQDQVNDGFKKMIATFGSVDIVINSAGVADDTKIDLMININLGGVIHTSVAAMQNMGKHNGHKGGALLNIASVAGLVPVPFIPTYTASKYGIVGFNSAIQKNFGKTGVRVLTICPGLTNTSLAMKLMSKQKLDFVDYENVFTHADQVIWQETDIVAKTIVDLFERGENGAICVVQNSEPPYLVDPPKIHDLPRRPF
ncbi:15-hydroxyprostaglandin dehydrogenase [NAD(+)]-like isoform X2 [Nomia melanderi]